MLFWTVDICAQAEEIYSVLIISLFNELMMVIPQGKLGVYFCILLFFQFSWAVLLPVFAKLVNCKICSLATVVVVALLNTLSRKHNIGRHWG